MITTAKKFLGRIWRDISGSSLTEFALISPILLALAVGAIDYGMIVSETAVLENAARAGAQYALSGTVSEEQIRAALLNAGTYNGEDLTVSVSYRCECPDGTQIACSGEVCSAGNSDAYGDTARRRYIAVTVEETYAPLFSYPWLPSPYSLEGTASIRLY